MLFPRDDQEVREARQHGSKINWGAVWFADEYKRTNHRSELSIMLDTRRAFEGLAMLEDGAPLTHLSQLLSAGVVAE